MIDCADSWMRVEAHKQQFYIVPWILLRIIVQRFRLWIPSQTLCMCGRSDDSVAELNRSIIRPKFCSKRFSCFWNRYENIEIAALTKWHCQNFAGFVANSIHRNYRVYSKYVTRRIMLRCGRRELKRITLLNIRRKKQATIKDGLTVSCLFNQSCDYCSW